MATLNEKEFWSAAAIAYQVALRKMVERYPAEINNTSEWQSVNTPFSSENKIETHVIKRLLCV